MEEARCGWEGTRAQQPTAEFSCSVRVLGRLCVDAGSCTACAQGEVQRLVVAVVEVVVQLVQGSADQRQC